MSALVYGVPIALLLVAIYGLITTRNLVHLVGCLNVLQSAVFLFLIVLGYRQGASAPVFPEPPPHPPAVDPVVQAMVVTGIVVGATTTALLLALALQLHRRRGTLDPAELLELQG